MHISEEQLKTFLLNAGLASISDIEEAYKEAQKKNTSLSDELSSSEYLSEESLRRAEAHVAGVPYVRLDEESLDGGVLLSLPENIAREHDVVAIEKTEGVLRIALLNLNELPKIQFLEEEMGLTLVPYITDSNSLKRALRMYQKILKRDFGENVKVCLGGLKEREQSLSLESAQGTTPHEDEEREDNAHRSAHLKEQLKEYAKDKHSALLFSHLIAHAHREHASDIHIEPYDEKIVVRYRIGGRIYNAMELPETAHTALIARGKYLCGLDLTEKNVPQNGKCRIAFAEASSENSVQSVQPAKEKEGETISLRIGIMPTQTGERMMIRLLAPSAKGFTLEGLGFVGNNLDNLHRALQKRGGMVLVAGGARSGKTTTLYTILDILNTDHTTIATLEDPVEYQIPHVSQTQVNLEQGLTFLRGLRGILRQDPDVIMVSELRETESLLLSARAALSGKRVLSALHTEKRAVEIPTLLKKTSEPFSVVSSLNALVVARLIPKLGPGARKVRLSKKELEILKETVNTRRLLRLLREEGLVKEGETWRDIYFYTPDDTRDDGGFEGRVGVYEVLPVTQAIKDLIEGEATPAKIEAQAKKEGMVTLIEDGIIKAVAGQTSLDEVLRLAS